MYIGKIFKFSICILAICFSNLFYSQITTVQAEDILEVKLEVHAPFSTATVIINNQGHIDYTANSPDTGINKLNDFSNITLEQFQELIDLINNNNFFSLEEKYIEENLADATTYTVTVKKGNQTKTVSCYGTCPEQVSKIIAKIKELWGREILEVGV